MASVNRRETGYRLDQRIDDTVNDGAIPVVEYQVGFDSEGFAGFPRVRVCERSACLHDWFDAASATQAVTDPEDVRNVDSLVAHALEYSKALKVLTDSFRPTAEVAGR